MSYTLIDERMSTDALKTRFPLMWATLYDIVYDSHNYPVEATVFSVAPIGSDDKGLSELFNKHPDSDTLLWPTTPEDMFGGGFGLNPDDYVDKGGGLFVKI